MRAFEILLLATLLAGWIGLLVPRSYLHLRLRVVPVVVFGLLHASREGLRLPMVPAYALTLAMLFTAAAIWLTPNPGRRAWTLGRAFALTAVLVSIGAATVLPAAIPAR